jgi:ABC-type nitrate/sulfonate/bicarbonate transport system permease component
MYSSISKWQVGAIQVGVLIALLAAWDYVGENKFVNPVLLPSLRNVFSRLVRVIESGVIWTHFTVTLLELLAGFAIAALAGLVTGYFIGRSRTGVIVFEPLLAGLFAIPLVVFLPLFILYFGIGSASKVAFGAAYAFFPIALNTLSGVRNVEQRYVAVARSMGANPSQMFWRVLLPAALPVIVTGLRVGCIICFLSIIGSEMIASLMGLGNRIVTLGEGMHTAEMFAYIVFVVAISMALNLGLTALERRFQRSPEAA